MPFSLGAAARPYHAIVFRRLPSSPDFTQSAQIVLPGRHTAAAAWDIVCEELRGPRGAQLVGGMIRACEA